MEDTGRSKPSESTEQGTGELIEVAAASPGPAWVCARLSVDIL